MEVHVYYILVWYGMVWYYSSRLLRICEKEIDEQKLISKQVYIF